MARVINPIVSYEAPVDPIDSIDPGVDAYCTIDFACGGNDAPCGIDFVCK